MNRISQANMFYHPAYNTNLLPTRSEDGSSATTEGEVGAVTGIEVAAGANPEIRQKNEKHKSDGELIVIPLDGGAVPSPDKKKKKKKKKKKQNVPENEPPRFGGPVRSTSQTSVISKMSEVTVEPDLHEAPADPENGRPCMADEMNKQHQSIEYPPLYFFLKSLGLLDAIEQLYRFRWKVSYPLQRRVPLSKYLQKYNIFFTWGELLILVPLIISILLCIIGSFLDPSVSTSGHASRNALIFAFVTAYHNSLLTMLIGLPFERALWYHKLAGRIAFVSGIFHTYVAYRFPTESHLTDKIPVSSGKGEDPHFGDFLFYDTVNTGGSLLMLAMTIMVMTSVPWIRRRVFELFYFIHIIFAVACLGCAFYHTGIFVPILGGLTYGIDLFVRRIYMSYIRYPRKAKVSIISKTVVELSFQKTGSFDYNPGQYCFMCVPGLSLFEWHPFSISSSPHQDTVTFHIRAGGNWTKRLYAMAQKSDEIDIMLEGPYGSVGLDMMSDRYQMVMLVSGGIGVTPMQSLCNQLLYEHAWKIRSLEKLKFVWMERDPQVMDNLEAVRRHGSSLYLNTSKRKVPRRPSMESMANMSVGMQTTVSHNMSIANTVLAMAGRDEQTTDQELEAQYHFDERSLLESQPSAPSHRPGRLPASQTMPTIYSPEDSDQSVDDSTIDIGDVENPTGVFKKKNDAVLDMQVCITSKDVEQEYLSMPFVHKGRPDLEQVFMEMRIEAISRGQRRVAVCICAPLRLVHICHKLAMAHSCDRVTFDFHEEVFS